jgi:hypothetical protein
MAEFLSQHATALFLAAWAVLAAVSIGFLFRWDAGRKRKFFPILLVGSGVIFIAFVLATGPIGAKIMVVPAVGLIMLLNFRTIKFCGNCNATVNSRNPFVPYKFCPKCGAPL